MSREQSEGFQGFTIPRQNWFKLPNEWTDITAEITSLAEMKVVEYVLRHTWGYHEYGQVKRITLDEFQHGRKTKDGTRMDKGIGMRKASVIDGIKRAVEDQLLVVKIDDSDKGRVKKSYALRMKGNSYPRGTETVQACTESLPGGYENCTPYRERHPRKKPKERHLAAKPPHTRNGSSRNGESPGLFTGDEFDRKAGGRLREILVRYDSDLVHAPYRVRVDTLAKRFTRLRTERKVSKEEIKSVLTWYRDHYGDQHTVKIHKADHVYSEWGRIRESKQRWDQDQDGYDPSAPSPARLKTIGEIRDRLRAADQYDDEGSGYMVNPSNLRRVLADMGLGSGEFKVGEI